MINKVVSPLTVDDLEGAAYICSQTAAFTDTEKLLGNECRRRHHERRKRFESALKLVKSGEDSLSKLKLKHFDYVWGFNMAHHAKEPAGWSSRFKAAASLHLQIRIREITDLFDAEGFCELDYSTYEVCVILQGRLRELDEKAYLTLKIERLERLLKQNSSFVYSYLNQLELDYTRAQKEKLK